MKKSDETSITISHANDFRKSNKFGASDDVARLWFLYSMIWVPIFTSFGLILAIKFFDPTFLGGDFLLTFGRIRPAHVNGILFGFLSSALIGAMFYIVPRLSDSPLSNPRLAKIFPLAWNLSVFVGIIMIMFGYSQGREYAEFPWVIDVVILLSITTISYLVLSTVMKRRERKLYVSIWYYSGMMLWFPVVYFVGNVMWLPPGGALSGTLDAIFNWYYGHNVLGLWFTPFGIAAWYYTIPIIIRRPLYSHRLSLISFFTLAFFYTGVGAHHILQAPIPEWLKTIAVITSVLMLVPVLTFIVNIGLTLRGFWIKIFENIPLRFIVSGFVMYGLVSIQGSFQALRSVNSYIHFSQWTVGHAHLALLGSFGFLVAGLFYWFVPKLTNKKIFSNKLMSLSYWLVLGGFIIFFSAMTLAGLVANAGWWQHLSIATVLPSLEVFFIVRAIGGGIIVVAAYIGAYNIIRTFMSKPSSERYESPKLVEVDYGK